MRNGRTRGFKNAAAAPTASFLDHGNAVGAAARYPINSVGKALDLLALLETRTELRVSTVSRALQVAPSTAHRLLAMYERAGLLEQAARHAPYTVAPALARIAKALALQADLRAAVRPVLLDLVREVDETAQVVVLRGSEIFFVDGVESSRSRHAPSRVGQTYPAHATAGGKALLAELPAGEVRRLYPAEELQRLTVRTIATRSTLDAELRRVRERGFARNAEESQRSFASYAAVVRDPAGTARAAIVLSAPMMRFKSYDGERMGAMLRAACTAAASAVFA